MMKRVFSITLNFMLLNLINAYAQVERNIEIVDAPCYYLMDTIGGAGPKSRSLRHVYERSPMFMKAVLMDSTGTVIKETYPIFDFCNAGNRPDSIGVNVGFHYVVNRITDAAGKHVDGDYDSSWEHVYLHLDHNLNVKQVYPANMFPCVREPKSQITVVSPCELHCGKYGIIDSCGNFLLPMKYEDFFFDEKKSEVVTMRVAMELEQQIDSAVWLDITHFDCRTLSSFSHLMLLPDRSLPVLSEPFVYSDLYYEEVEQEYSSYIIQDNTEDGRDLAMFHRGAYELVKEHYQNAIELFRNIYDSSGNRHFKDIAKYNMMKVEGYLSSGDTLLRTGTVPSRSGQTKAVNTIGSRSATLWMSEKKRFAGINRKTVFTKYGKKVVVTDGLAVKSTMPVFDDVEVVGKRIICTQRIPIYEGYDIRLKLTFNEDLDLEEVTEI